MTWLGLAIGAALIAILLWVQTHRPFDLGSFVRVSEDGDGTRKFRHLRRATKRLLVSKNGLSRVVPLVERLRSPSERFSILHMAPLRAASGLALHWDEDGPSLSFQFKSGRDADLEVRTREYMASAADGIRRDFLLEEGETRLLQWWISGSTSEISQLCIDALRALYQVKDDDGLSFKLTRAGTILKVYLLLNEAT